MRSKLHKILPLLFCMSVSSNVAMAECIPPPPTYTCICDFSAIRRNSQRIRENREEIEYNSSKISDNKRIIDNHGTRIIHIENLDKEQNKQLKEHKDRLTYHDAHLKIHELALDAYGKSIENLYDITDVHTNDIEHLDAVTNVHAKALARHEDILEIHGDRLDEHDSRLDGHDNRMDAMTIDYNNKFAGHKKILDTHTREISKLNSRVDELHHDLGKVGAGAAALASLHPLDFDPEAKLDVAAGLGHYGNNNAVALGAFYRPEENIQFNIGCTLGESKTMFGVGASFKLDGKDRHSRKNLAMTQEIIDLRTQVAMLTAKVNGLTAKQ